MLSANTLAEIFACVLLLRKLKVQWVRYAVFLDIVFRRFNTQTPQRGGVEGVGGGGGGGFGGCIQFVVVVVLFGIIKNGIYYMILKFSVAVQ